MARTRLLHPEFFKHEALAELPMAARILFAGLWTLADREGRLEDRPKRIKADIFPWDDVDVDALLWALDQANCIDRYEWGGDRFICIPGWKNWQSPHVNEKPSKIPGRDKVGAALVPVPLEHRPIDPVSVSNSVSVSDPVSVGGGTALVPELPGGGTRSGEDRRQGGERREETAHRERKPLPDNAFVRLKACFLAAYEREIGHGYFWDPGPDTKKANEVLALGLPEPELHARVDRFFRDGWCRAQGASFGLFRSQVTKLVKAPPLRALVQDVINEGDRAAQDERSRWLNALGPEERAAYWRELEATVAEHHAKPGGSRAAVAELEARYRALALGEAATA